MPRSTGSALDALPCTDVGIVDGVPFRMGSVELAPIHTPGHTDNHFAYDDDTPVYPAHDYAQRRISTIGQEKARNPRLGGERSLEDFVALMNNLKLAYPKFIDYAVPGNRECGAGRQPIAVTDHANTLHQAIDGAAQKMKRSLDSTLGKLGDHKRKPSTPGSEES
ncbi:MAG: hypothetical protein WCB97_08480 [Thiobacillus sp.]